MELMVALTERVSFLIGLGCQDRSRTMCQHVKPAERYEQGQRKEILTGHETPSRPWQFVAADLFEFNGKSYLVTVDYFSDFLELDHLRRPSSVYVIKKLKGHFARHGVPEHLVTDNGPQFASCDFPKFSKEWDFEHRTSNPHHS